MRALSIKQPWVHAILRCGKDIENRTWQCGYRGWIAIHASLKVQPDATLPRGCKNPETDSLDYGAICGVAHLVDIVTKSGSKWFTKPRRGEVNFGWVLTDVRRLQQPIVCKGSLGLWKVPNSVVAKMEPYFPKIVFIEH